MADTSLFFSLIGRDRGTRKAMEDVARGADRAGRGFDVMGAQAQKAGRDTFAAGIKARQAALAAAEAVERAQDAHRRAARAAERHAKGEIDAAAAGRAQARAARASERATIAHALAQKAAAEAIEDTSEELRNQAISFKLAGKAARGYILTLLGAAAATTVLSALAGGAAAATAATVALAAALAPAAGIVAAFPGLIASMVASMLTLKVALSGVGDAFKAALGDDPAKFAEALEKLSPAARHVAKELRALKPTLDGVRLAVQDAFFGPLKGELTALGKTLAGPVTAAMSGVSGAMGRAVVEVTRFARQRATVASIGTGFGNLRATIESLTPAIQPLLAGFRDIAIEGSTFLRQLAPGISEAATAFGEWLSKVSASGQALQWMHGALDVLKQLGTIIGNVGSIFVSFGQAAQATGQGLLSSLVRLTGQAAAFFKSAQGQETLRAVFAALRDVSVALMPVLKALAVGIGDLAPMFARLAVAAGPVLTKVIQGLVPVLLALEPGLMALVTAFGEAINVLVSSGGLTAIAQALAQIVVASAPLLPILAKVAAVLLTQLAVALKAIAPQLPSLVQAFGELLIALLPLLPPLAQIVVAATPLIPVIAGIISVIAKLATAVMPVLLTMFNHTMAAQRTLAAVFEGAWSAISGFVSGGVAFVRGVLAWFGRLPGLLGSWFSNARARVASAMSALGRGVSGVVNNVIGFFTRLRNGARDRITGLLSTIRGIPGRIRNALGNLGNLLWNAGRNIINGLVNGIRSAIGWLQENLSWVTSMIPSWKGPMQVDLRLLEPSGRALMSGLISGIDAERGTLQRTLAGVTGQISTSVPTPIPPPRAAGAAAARGGAPTVVLQIDSAGSRLDDVLVEALRRAIKSKGGNVQLVLGRG